MRVSYFYDDVIPNRFAAPIQILNTCRALGALGVRVTVYTRSIANGAAKCLAFYGLPPHENLRIAPLFSGRLPRRFNLRWKLPSILRTQAVSGEPHIIVARGEDGVALFRSLRGTKRAPGELRIYEAHRLCYAHEIENSQERRWNESSKHSRAVACLRAREKAAVEGADGLLCLTEGVKKALETSFQVTRPTAILPSGTNVFPASLAEVNAPERDIDILYVGKLERRKGVCDLIAAMPHLPCRRLWVVGGTAAEMEALAQFAKVRGVADRIVFTGFVEPSRIQHFMRRARVGVCPLPANHSVTSELFTSPLKILELMAHGVPVVATNLPSVREILTHEVTGVLAEPSNPESLALAIRRVLDNTAFAAQLRDRALAHVTAFSWQSRARRMLTFFHSLA